MVFKKNKKRLENQNEAYKRVSDEVYNLLTKAGYEMERIDVESDLSWKDWEETKRMNIEVRLKQNKKEVSNGE